LDGQAPGGGALNSEFHTERIDGPTPNGGAYAIAIKDGDGNVYEITEYLDDGTAVMRTYAAPPPREPEERDPP
jgi:hypothetical protein